MGYSKSRRSKGAPMERNFGIGKPGPAKEFPTIDESKNKLSVTPPKVTLNMYDDKPTNLIDKKRKDDIVEKEVKDKKTVSEANPTKAKNWWEEGYGEENKQEKYKSDGSLTTPEKDDYFSGLRPLQSLLGLSKEQRAARKLKKANKLTDAKAAEAGGTETFKQAKFVDKAEKKQLKSDKKTARKKAKSDKKLAKYRKKNS